MRIAIVNHLRSAVEGLRKIILSVPGREVCWVAQNGAEAVRKCVADKPDLILMDVIMPKVDGVEATRRIMSESPCPILVVTPTVDGNAGKVFEAMGHGALDAINTPLMGNDPVARKSREALLKKIEMIGKLGGVTSKAPTPKLTRRISREHVPPLIVIGSSTGGPKALAEVLSRLPAGLDAAIVIVQHVDGAFSAALADWLDQQTPLRVKLAPGGGRPKKGTVFLAGTGEHLVLTPDLRFSYTQEPRSSNYRPSVDTFFKSVADHWPEKCVAVLLTGMGRDGAEGLAVLRQAGWHTMAQDEETSIVYGMPKAAKELGSAVEILPVGKIALAIRRFLQKPSAGTL
ncbi:MAG: chemotaxis response regulator protein-glutamate methylesterase [Desulfobacteraceae bacterium]|nr:chemotaxis response regulator protein-glutamate methylesterase [Desulfobacteraceae bacterium]